MVGFSSVLDLAYGKRHAAGMIWLCAGAAGLGVVSSGSPAWAGVIFNDTFESQVSPAVASTKADDAFDPTDIPWYSALSGGSVSVVDDAFAGGGSARALQLAVPSSDNFRRMGGSFASTTLGATAGDTLTLNFVMRLAEAPTANATGFRFGLYNSAGTVTTSDNANGISQPTGQNDDFGYFVRMATATTTGNMELLKEAAIDSPTGGSSTGQSVLGSSATPNINDQTIHTLSLVVTRVSTSSISFAASFDGTTYVTGTDSTSPYTTFDTVYISLGNVSTDVRVDNISLIAQSVPEPASLGLLAVGAVGLLARRRR